MSGEPQPSEEERLLREAARVIEHTLDFAGPIAEIEGQLGEDINHWLDGFRDWSARRNYQLELDPEWREGTS